MSDTPIAVIVNCETGQVEERPLTAEEIAQREADAAAAAAAEAERVAAEEAKAAAKASAVAKLEALGLTADEASALLGV
jgi:membrane protein involved in colicin uptake